MRFSTFAAGFILVGAVQAPVSMVPDHSLTPGVAASTDVGVICEKVKTPEGGALLDQTGHPLFATKDLTYSRRHRKTTEEDRKLDFATYNIPWDLHDSYEDDHLLPLCLGGADAMGNRWPQSLEGQWNAHMKDKLEDYACRQVCEGKLSLDKAQHWFLSPADWRDAYKQVFGNP